MRSLYIQGNQAAKTPASFPKASRFKHLAKVLPLKEWTDLCTAEFRPPLPANIIGLDTGGDTHTLTIFFLNLIQIFSRTRICCIWVILKTGRVRWFLRFDCQMSWFTVSVCDCNMRGGWCGLLYILHVRHCNCRAYVMHMPCGCAKWLCNQPAEYWVMFMNMCLHSGCPQCQPVVYMMCLYGACFHGQGENGAC